MILPSGSKRTHPEVFDRLSIEMLVAPTHSRNKPGRRTAGDHAGRFGGNPSAPHGTLPETRARRRHPRGTELDRWQLIQPLKRAAFVPPPAEHRRRRSGSGHAHAR